MEKLFLKGDLSVLTSQEKVSYYNEYCKRLGLDPFTQPFKLLNLQGKEILYCDRSGTQQLSKIHSVSHEIKSREVINGCYVVTAQASVTGRHTESIGAVPINKANGTWETASSGKKFLKPDGTFTALTGDDLCNAMMKAETKAKRRATLDLLGLGVLDETEVETIPNVQTIEIKEAEPVTQQAIANAKTELNLATSFSELQLEWGKLPKEVQANKEIVALKNELKKKLTPQHS